MAERDTNKYVYKVGNKIVHAGISKRDLKKRESEHRNSGRVLTCNGKDYDFQNGHIIKVGNKTTREAALRWERDNRLGANQGKDFCKL